MKRTKEQKAITLVALIITIVILLILAVVAIGAVQEDGIIGKAKYARDEYEKAQAKENSILQGYLDKLNDNTLYGNAGGSNNTSVDYLGKHVRYDVDGDGVIEDNEYESILWRVLRNDADKVELITADAVGNLEFTQTDFNDARNKYNNAVSLMVEECKRVTGIESNIRNIGGPATDTTTETVDFSELEYFNPNVSDENFAQYEGENGFKIGDNNWEEDYNQMKKAGVAQADNSSVYWLASRYVNDSNNVYFYVRLISENGGYNDWYMGYVREDSTTYSSAPFSHPVRPVLTLESGILDNVSEAGTKDDPIKIY